MILATNQQAFHEYHILETLEAGVALSGPEVKAAKGGRINLKGGYATIDQNGQAWLINVHIAAYPPAIGVQKDYNPTRSRKLLLHKKEIADLSDKLKAKGLTFIPLKVYTEHRFIKIELGLAKGKKDYDKRETLKKRDIERNIRQALRQKV